MAVKPQQLWYCVPRLPEGLALLSSAALPRPDRWSTVIDPSLLAIIRG